MKSYSVIAALAGLATSVAGQAMINSPVLVQCQPSALVITGGVAPYFLRVLPGGQPDGTPLAFLPNQAQAGTYTWNVNIAAGTTVTIAVIDSTGVPNYSSPLTIQSSPDSSCLGQAASGAPTVATSAAPSVTSAVSSNSGTLVTSGVSATVTAATSTPTGTIGNNITASTYNFTCAPGAGLLTYGIAVAELDGLSLAQAVRYFGNWTAGAPGPLVNSTVVRRAGGVGSTRAYTLGANATIYETLRLNQTNATTGALKQQWNFTTATPVALSPALTVYNAFDDLTVYTNDTTSTTEVQYFILACFNDQVAGLTTLAAYIEQSLTYWSTQIAASANSTTSATRRLVKLF